MYVSPKFLIKGVWSCEWLATLGMEQLSQKRSDHDDDDDDN